MIASLILQPTEPSGVWCRDKRKCSRTQISPEGYYIETIAGKDPAPYITIWGFHLDNHDARGVGSQAL